MMTYELKVFFHPNTPEARIRNIAVLLENYSDVASVEVVSKKVTPLSRPTDPITSTEAAASVDSSPLQRRILTTLKTRPYLGMTCAEVGFALGMPASSVARRMTELQRKGLARASGERRNRFTGKKSRIWFSLE